MAASWQVVFCLLVLIVHDCSAIRDVLELETKETPMQARVKRKAQDCRELEVKGWAGHQNILDAKEEETSSSFSILPLQGFSSLVFRPKVKKKYFSSSWRYYKDSLVVNSSRMEIDRPNPMWIPVEIKYLKKKVSLGPDQHTLNVKVGRNVNKSLIFHLWGMHSYEGFAVEAVGPVKVRFNCKLPSPEAESVVDTEGEGYTVLTVSLLSCLLLLVGSAALYLLITRARRSSPSQDNPCNTPPQSLPLQLRGHPARKSECTENIYESLDESTLKKIRQNLSADKLYSNLRDQCSGGLAKSNNTTMTTLDQCSGGLAESNASTKASLHPVARVPGAAQDALAFSLLEEKEAMRDRFGLDSPVESHYVEMHGIVSRTSSLNK